MNRFACGVLAVGFFCVPALPVWADNGNWADRITLKGDVRLRHERIDEDGEEERARMRFRARLGLSADISDDIDFTFQLATGGDNPVSTNQSFDGGFSTKDIGVDLAYLRWNVNEQFTLYGGKMKNPLYRAGGAPLIWDGDLNPEGIAAQFESGSLFATAGAFAVEERSAADDSLLYALQVGNEFSLGDNGKLTAGVGYFTYTNTVGNTPFYNGNPRGNSVDANGDYLFDYGNAEAFAQFDGSLADWPLRIFAQYTQNGEVDQEDTAIAFGFRVGSAKNQGTSEFSWTWMDVEADAVIGTFSDSDFGGGGTDSSGHMLKGKYMLRDRISLGGTLFLNDVDRFQGIEHDYSRLQIDVEFKFN